MVKIADHIRKAVGLAGLFLLLACGVRKQQVDVLPAGDEDVARVAGRLAQAGYRSLPGRLPVEEQLAEAWRYQRARDEQGQPLYVVGSSKATARDYNAARLQAESLAKVQLAGWMQTRVGQLVTNRLEASGQLGGDAVMQTAGSSKNLVSERLTYLVPLLELFCENPDGSVEVQVVIGCPCRAADEIARQLTADSEP